MLSFSDNLLQPKMKKRRSVTKLTEKDTKGASKYVLTHQAVDSDGDMATKYVKVQKPCHTRRGTHMLMARKNNTRAAHLCPHARVWNYLVLHLPFTLRMLMGSD